MTPETADPEFKILAVDNVAYGPVDLPTLVSWVKDERILPDTWVFQSQTDGWAKARDLPQLQIFFSGNPANQPPRTLSSNRDMVKPGTLRRVKIFAELTDRQLERFIDFMEVQSVSQWTDVVKQGETGRAMYLVLEGEVRVRMLIAGKERIIATLATGEFFGEMSLFDDGPRSADVVSNSNSVLLRISSDAFRKLVFEAPELAGPFLFAMGKTFVSRIRADNKRFRDSVNFARTAGF